MPSFQVSLRFTPNGKRASLRELCGHDELSVEAPGTLAAIRLLDKLLLDSPRSAASFVAADRDRALAAVYKKTYTGNIESTVVCAACASLFDLRFSVDDLLAYLDSGQGEAAEAQEVEPGIFQLPGKTRFRLLTGEDESVVLDLPQAEAESILLERCLLEGDPETEGEAVQRAMRQVAPLLSTELAAICPECGHGQTLQFDLQTFLLSALQMERKSVIREVHCLATAYRWSHREILELPRSLRRAYVALVMETAGR